MHVLFHIQVNGVDIVVIWMKFSTASAFNHLHEYMPHTESQIVVIQIV